MIRRTAGLHEACTLLKSNMSVAFDQHFWRYGGAAGKCGSGVGTLERTHVDGANMLRPSGLRRVICVGVFVCLGSLSPLAEKAFADIELFIAPSGDDTASGTEAEPLATLAGAQQRLRSLRTGAQSAEPAQVWLLEGIYQLQQPLEFTADDNSPVGAATTYAAKPGHKVIVRGGRAITPSQLLPVSDASSFPVGAREHVRTIDLSTLGIEEIEDHAPSRARHQPMHPRDFELFSGERRLPLASWPNHGWARVTQVQPDGLRWPVPQDLKISASPTGAMAHGFWAHDWQDSCEPISIEHSPHHGWLLGFDRQHADHVGKIREGARYRIENLMSQLDQPGEWYLDRKGDRVVLWPAQEMERDGLFVSTLDTPISIYDAVNLTLRGLTIEGAGACCVEIAGGEHVCLDNCLIRHAGNLGINIYHGAKHRVINCEVTSTGAGAIRVEGGERETLTPCEHVIENCRLHDFAQLHLAYRPGVNVYGVGVSVLGNEIYDAPHSAVILHGNEHRVEGNDIHHVCQETEDAGAIYLGHNPTFRGNKIHYNTIHDLGGFSRTDVIGIYLDDFACGTDVTHNVLMRAGRGVAIGGGRDNVIDNNLFVDCLAAVQIDNRGSTWARHYVAEDAPLARYCREIDVTSGVHAETYPELTTLLSDQPGMAKGNRISRNLIEGEIGVDLHDGLDESVVELRNNFKGAKALLTDIDQGDYRVRKGTAAEKIGFESVGPRKVVYVAR